jgi:hypothetical protein
LREEYQEKKVRKTTKTGRRKKVIKRERNTKVKDIEREREKKESILPVA